MNIEKFKLLFNSLILTVVASLFMGTKEYEQFRDRGGGFIIASVINPFENILGIIVQSSLSGYSDFNEKRIIRILQVT